MIAFVIAILALDTTIAFQLLLSQPVFSCSILGFLMGDAMTGAQIGTMMQLLWLNAVPTGGVRAPEGEIASMVTCAIVLLFSSAVTPNVLLTVAFVMGLIVSHLAMSLTSLRRQVNRWFYHQVLQAIEEDKLSRIGLLHWGPPLFYVAMVTTGLSLIFAALSFGVMLFADKINKFEQQLFLD